MTQNRSVGMSGALELVPGVQGSTFHYLVPHLSPHHSVIHFKNHEQQSFQDAEL